MAKAKRRRVDQKKTFGARPARPTMSNDRYAAPTAVPRRTVQLPFGPLILKGSCVVCSATLAEHFKDGEYVGCSGVTRPAHVPITFVPPFVISSDELTAAVVGSHVTAPASQSHTGAVITPPSPSSEPSKFGRRPELIVPIKERVEASNPKVHQVLERLVAHKDEGITLKALVEEMKMPYSTVQTQINKLAKLHAIEKHAAA